MNSTPQALSEAQAIAQATVDLDASGVQTLPVLLLVSQAFLASHAEVERLERRCGALTINLVSAEAFPKRIEKIVKRDLALDDAAVDAAIFTMHGRQIDPIKMAPAVIKWNGGIAKIEGLLKNLKTFRERVSATPAQDNNQKEVK